MVSGMKSYHCFLCLNQSRSLGGEIQRSETFGAFYQSRWGVQGSWKAKAEGKGLRTSTPLNEGYLSPEDCCTPALMGTAHK